MAESTESKSIKELTKAVKDEQKQNRAKLEEIANSTSKSLEAIKDRAKAKQALQKQDATLKEQQKISGLSAKRIQKADVLEQSIQRQQEIMEAQKAALENLGIDSATNKKFQEEELKLAKMQKAQAKATGSADAEDAAKHGSDIILTTHCLKHFALFLSPSGKVNLDVRRVARTLTRSLFVTKEIYESTRHLLNDLHDCLPVSFR